MRFNGKLSEADFDDVRRILRSKMYWPKLVLANWYGVTLVCIVTWATVMGLVGKSQPNWTAVAAYWAMIIAVVAWMFYRTRRSIAKQLQQLNVGLPDWLSVEDNGMKAEGPNGATSFQPWQSVTGCREGKRVILLDLENSAFMILPLSERSAAERDWIKQLLVSHVQCRTEAAVAR